MVTLDRLRETVDTAQGIAERSRELSHGRVLATADDANRLCLLACGRDDLSEICQWLTRDLDFSFATLIVEELTQGGWSLVYVFYKDAASPSVHVTLQLGVGVSSIPSLVGLVHGPSFDWHEREAEDLFGLRFEGHPRLGEFVLHEDWPEGINPMRRSFNGKERFGLRTREPRWDPQTVVATVGAFTMPIGPVFSDFAESAHFLLETVGEDVIRTIPRFFYKYRGVEKIAEGQMADRALLLAERFSGVAAFAHGLAFCQAVETICGFSVPPRARALRTALAELERLRSHAAVITGICNSTALVVAASQAALIEESLIRLSCDITGHRYLFGAVALGGVSFDLSDEDCSRLAKQTAEVAERLRDLFHMLRYSSSFLDRLEEVGIVAESHARSYGLVGPIARASGVARDVRKLLPYAAYDAVEFSVPLEHEGDGYARLRVLFEEAVQSAAIIRSVLSSPPIGPVDGGHFPLRAGAALAAVEAPLGAAFHWLRLDGDGSVVRYHVTPPSFANWHGFHIAAENFAFQDFPIILASFGLSNAECDR
jgi:Ni,Fe-hydrogenase III large subunit/Ni,Fe-hydrogenase III component G